MNKNGNNEDKDKTSLDKNMNKNGNNEDKDSSEKKKP
jgi:hypothetical protein